MAEQQEEGLLEKIHALVAPPQSSSSSRFKGKKARLLPASVPSQKHGGIENNPFCNACGDGGSLLCCDSCPASFHFYCCDPPVDSRNLPTGEWLCRSCTALEPADSTPPLFRPLLEQACAANPLIFNIPEELKTHDLLPGQSRKYLGQRARLEEREGCVRFCFACNQRVHTADLAQCDFCPLHFHLSCVDPPLTTPPSSAWMCPAHPHHSIPDFEHPRLSRRLLAMEKGREEIQHHRIKLDFLARVNRMPHYKRITRHLKRRVAKVPPAVKALYSDPLPEASEAPPLSESLVGAAEVCQWWRGEEGRRRREFAAVTASSSHQPPLTHAQDEWTRRAVLCQLDRHSSPPPDTMTRNKSGTRADSCHDDLAVSIAASQLLELSKRVSFNNFLRTHKFDDDGPEPDSCGPNSDSRGPHSDTFALKSDGKKIDHHEQNSVNDVEMHVAETTEEMGAVKVNGFCEVNGEGREREMGEEGRGTLQSAAEEMEVEEGGGVNGEEAEGVSGDSVQAVERGKVGGGPHAKEVSELEKMKDECVRKEDRMETVERAVDRQLGGESGTQDEEAVDSALFVPDISLLDPRLVQFLATQRLQQLFTAAANGPGSPHASSQSTHPRPHPLLTKNINGMKPLLPIKPAKPVLTTEQLKTAQSVLCPVSGIGTAFAVHKHVTLIGTGSDVDIGLSLFGHCNYLSPRHACIFYNKGTEEYELLNYSDHGSVVDGVLYSCDFSEKTVTEAERKEACPLTLADLALEGHGLKAERAKAKIENARKNLRDHTHARRALEGALCLSKLAGKDDAAGDGSRRTTYNSSVVSIPLALSRTKKLSAGVAPNPGKDFKMAAASPSASGSRSVPGTPEKQASAPTNSTPKKTISTGLLGTDPPSTPCLCRRSASCLVGTNRKGWEGTATLYHGSRLRFGCLQFVFSVAGRPGHTELINTLSSLLQSHRT